MAIKIHWVEAKKISVPSVPRAAKTTQKTEAAIKPLQHEQQALIIISHPLSI